MKKIVAKNVSMLELFYDLIFVYAISKITMMIHHPVNEGLPVKSYLEFIIVVFVVMQVWLYQTLYINRFGSSRVIDIIGLLVNMFSAVYLSNNINTDWRITFHAFNTSMILAIIDLIIQYAFGSNDHPWENQDIRAFLISLTFELIIVALGVAIGYKYGVHVVLFGMSLGFLIPLSMYKMFKPTLVNFPHLVERLSLIVIITFGETIVNITGYFKTAIYAPLPIVIFLLVASLFGVYTILVEKFINHHQYSRGFIAMYSHILLIINLLSITVGLIYLADKDVSRIFLSIFFVINLWLFYLGLWFYSIYNKPELQFTKKDLEMMASVLIIGGLMTILLRNNDLGLTSAIMATNVVEFLLLEFRLHVEE